MGIVYEKSSGLVTSNTFDKFVTLKKRNIERGCWGCERKTPKGSYSLGNGYFSICFNCAEIWYDNSLTEMLNFIRIMEIERQKVQLNKDKWNSELVGLSL